jgi:transaldolase
MNNTYLNWLITNTKTEWWHDSADLTELQLGLERGAVGVTTNPFLSNIAVQKYKSEWAAEVSGAIAGSASAEAKAEALMRIAVTKVAQKLMPEYERSTKARGFVCAQVNPLRAGERQPMHEMAKRLHAWSPNIAVKLPCTLAGLDVLEDCIAEGITITSTVSFTTPQALAIAERHRKGAERARQKGIEPGKCFAVIMIGRLDDYLREVAQDNAARVTESDIQQSGLAATKRAYKIYRQKGYEAVLLVAALRGSYHLTELAGGELIMSIAPGAQKWFVEQDHPREVRIDKEIPADVIDRLRQMPEFVRAFEPDGMQPEEFVTYGATQRTLSQFCEVGWKLLEGCK